MRLSLCLSVLALAACDRDFALFFSREAALDGGPAVDLASVDVAPGASDLALPPPVDLAVPDEGLVGDLALDLAQPEEPDLAEPPASCDDNVRNGKESDVDCGGPCKACPDGKRCRTNDDCQAGPCIKDVCGCLMGEVACNGACVDVSTDPAHCGGCGKACSGNNIAFPLCQAGKCAGKCNGNAADCNADKLTDGCEADVGADPMNCGGCGMTCAVPNGAPGCSGGMCVIGSCGKGFADCNKNVGDGCEAKLESDPKHCGACGVACSMNQVCVGNQCVCDRDPANQCAEVCGARQVCVQNQCLAARLIFVSSEMYTGNLGGLMGADAKCQALADAACLGGTFKAWLSAMGDSAADRLVHSAIPYRLTDGSQVALNWGQLTSGMLGVPINRDEKGAGGIAAEVWTDTTANGSWGGGGCNGFTSASVMAPFAMVGLSDKADGQWTSVFQQFCDRNNVRLYCVEQ